MSEENNHSERGAKVTNIKTVERPVAASSSDQHLERFAKSFEASARRWELVVYPTLFAFIVLASYGFYLIYSLTHDVGLLSRNVASLTSSIDHMVQDMDSITGSMGQVSQNMQAVATKMDSLEPMRESMKSIDDSAHAMAVSTERMGYHMGQMNYNVGRPMGAMNSFIPW